MDQVRLGDQGTGQVATDTTFSFHLGQISEKAMEPYPKRLFELVDDAMRLLNWRLGRVAVR